MKSLWTVAWFTMKDMLSRKSFIISTIVILALMVIGFNIPNIINSVQEQNATATLIVDSDNIFEGSLAIMETLNPEQKYEISNENLTRDEISQKIENGEIGDCIVITKKENNLNIEMIRKSVSLLNQEDANTMQLFTQVYKELQISKLGLSEKQLANLNPIVNLTTTSLDDKSIKMDMIGFSMILSILLFYAIYFCAYQVSTSITTEKTSRIMETLITSTKPRTIVLGKTLGIGIVGLMQMLAIVIVRRFKCILLYGQRDIAVI